MMIVLIDLRSVALLLLSLLIDGMLVLVEWLQAKHVRQGLVVEQDLYLQRVSVEHQVVEVLLSLSPLNVKLVNQRTVRQVVNDLELLSRHFLEMDLGNVQVLPVIQREHQS